MADIALPAERDEASGLRVLLSPGVLGLDLGLVVFLGLCLKGGC